jgi:hypothetical protein
MGHVNHRRTSTINGPVHVVDIRVVVRIMIQAAHAGPNVGDIGGLNVGIVNVVVVVAGAGGGVGWMLRWW